MNGFARGLGLKPRHNNSTHALLGPKVCLDDTIKTRLGIEIFYERSRELNTGGGGLGEFLKVMQILESRGGGGGGLGEFLKVMQILESRDLHNCLEFSRPAACLDEAI